MKPLFMWAGGKRKLIPKYLPYIPKDITYYCEPFFGAGAMFVHVMKHHRPKRIVINDSNASLMNIYRSIKEDFLEFDKNLSYLEQSYLQKSKEDRKKYYYEVRHSHAYDYTSWSSTKEAATLYFLLKTGFNGIYQINKNTNGRYGTPCGLLNQKDRVYDKDVMKWWSESLQQVEIYSSDWKDVSDQLPLDTFFFFDPPYRNCFADYGQPFTDDSLIDLIDFCNDRKYVMISNRDDDHWFLENRGSLDMVRFGVTYTAGRRKKNIDGKFEAKKATEVLLYKNS
jgi:DNA adenine methylase